MDSVRIPSEADAVRISDREDAVRIPDAADAVRFPDRGPSPHRLHRFSASDDRIGFDVTDNTILLTREYCGEQWNILRA